VHVQGIRGALRPVRRDPITRATGRSTDSATAESFNASMKSGLHGRRALARRPRRPTGGLPPGHLLPHVAAASVPGHQSPTFHRFDTGQGVTEVGQVGGQDIGLPGAEGGEDRAAGRDPIEDGLDLIPGGEWMAVWCQSCRGPRRNVVTVAGHSMSVAVAGLVIVVR